MNPLNGNGGEGEEGEGGEERGGNGKEMERKDPGSLKKEKAGLEEG